MANLSNINNILRVSSSGVGINKNNTGPSELDIESAGADMIDMTRTNLKTYRLAISGTSDFSIFDVVANEDRLTIDSSGYVGIGTSTPNTALQVNQSTTVPLLVHRQSNTNFDPHGIGFSTRSDAIDGGLGDVRSGIFSDYNGDLFLAAATSSITTSPLTYSRLFIEGGNGNVGIGTDSPGAKLSVQNTSTAVTSLLLGNNSGSTGDYQQIVFQYSQTDTSYRSAIRSRVQAGGVHGGNLSFWTDQNGTTTLTERMTIDRVGNVGIGTTDPSYGKLQIDQAAGNNLTLRKGTGYAAIAFGGVTGNEATFLLEGNASQGFRIYNGTGTLASPTWTAGMDFYDQGRLHPYGGVFLGSSNNDQLLNYYKEGTWTPNLLFGGNEVGITYAGAAGTVYRGGHYTRIGRVVTFSFRIILTSKGTSVGSATITGLPFIVANLPGNYGSAMYSFANNFAIPERASITMDNNTSIIRLRFTQSTGAYGNVTNSNFNDNSDIILTGTYQAPPA